MNIKDFTPKGTKPQETQRRFTQQIINMITTARRLPDKHKGRRIVSALSGLLLRLGCGK